MPAYIHICICIRIGTFRNMLIQSHSNLFIIIIVAAEYGTC